MYRRWCRSARRRPRRLLTKQPPSCLRSGQALRSSSRPSGRFVGPCCDRDATFAGAGGHTVDFEAMAAAVGLPISLAAITGWISGALASRRALAAAATDRRRRAASAVREAIQELHDLLWNAYIGEHVEARAVADLMAKFEGLVRRHEPPPARRQRPSAPERSGGHVLCLGSTSGRSAAHSRSRDAVGRA